jgi:hypothetical protein
LYSCDFRFVSFAVNRLPCHSDSSLQL